MEDPVTMAEQLREELSAGTKPLDITAAARRLRCQVSQCSSLRREGVEAELRPHPSQNRFYIKVDPTPRHGWGETAGKAKAALSRQRFRFRACHEIGHAIHHTRRPGRGPQRSQPWVPSEELWCDEFARALLVPPRAAHALPATASSAFELQRQFDVSLEVALRALAAAHPGCEAALWFWPAGEPGRTDSLLRQWINLPEGVSLRPWLQSDLIDRALEGKGSAGSLPALAGTSRRQATVVAATERRQVVLVVA